MPSKGINIFGSMGSISSSTSSTNSDWEIDPDDELNLATGKPLELNKKIGAFRARTAKEIESKQKYLGPPEAFKENGPVRNQRLKYIWLRGVGKLIGLFGRETPVYHKPIKDIVYPQPKPENLTKPDDAQVDIFTSDRNLASYLTGSEPVFVRTESDRPLFNASEPIPEDVRQSDSRATCYLLSALASYAASPVGKQLLLNNIHPLKPGYALVKFHDPSLEQAIQVMVKTDRLIDQKGADLYSFDNDSRSSWVGTVEKAFHSFRTSMKERIESFNRVAKSEKDGEAEIHYQALLQDLIDKGEDHTTLDHSHIFKAIRFLPPMPECADPPEGLVQDLHSPVLFNQDDLSDKRSLELLKANVDNGVPMILGTRSDAAGIVNAIYSGTPTDHAVAVLGPATTLVDGKPVEGLLIYDTYGDSLDGNSEVDHYSPTLKSKRQDSGIDSMVSKSPVSEFEAAFEWVDITDAPSPETDPDLDGFDVVGLDDLLDESEVDSDFGFEKVEGFEEKQLLTKASGRAVRFFPYSDLHKYFSRGATAVGGLRPKSS
ncbi:hypothetical protein [Endozoicomonas numazuensis]|uniref:Calpain catalytic domain-containing protein n=1 Tax=Endozoicomonas numazuensis TaxID=1137799 RepID=A0A081ND71_9GAMM|nr:hypothetical protein [Endozoicomonas numazuensis]KEQ16394.1 hypothetical protein GZ78_21215 [Endozoicomonas numazuensis]